ncbi:RNA recognition motif domain eukaryote [Arabidopsis thaliana x Arabidopsis arenosa]|uniref:RNA recognition motif domain eukaryote n=1 Tax=Arabidopsis thaliana x Arabidopsis arenosa TaxID=1240361 RepID=A0A8T1XK32_9BRAS|nr:RNA recognition motif domain eukaryote [Arabidopsis thaliana x Arabidopsis arenosa]
MSDHGEKTCPLCAEEMDLTDQQLKPCKCGYQICVWCWHHIVDMAEKDQIDGRCPACRTPYDKEKIVGMTVNCDSLASEGNMERKKIQKSKSKPSEGRKQQLTSVRVIQRNLVYIVGLPLNLADEDLLQHKEYFGRYGKVLKVSMSRTASGVIQQFPNNTCSVYITYGKEEEAVRCIQAVHGFILDGKPLKACFGTTKYCHAWLRNVACVNPDCLYLHEVGSQDDSFTKDEIISAYTRSRVQQITGATNILQHRSGSMLPPPLDAYCSDSSSAKPIIKVPSTNATSVPRYSPPSGSGGSSRSTALPAAASWGTHQSLATSVTSNGSSDIQRSTSVNGTLPFSALVANAAHGPVSSSDILKRPSRKEESQIVMDKVKPSVLNPLQNNVVVSGSERTTSPDRDPTSNRLSSSVDSSYGGRDIDQPSAYSGRDIDKPSATVNSFDDVNEAVEDGPTVNNLSDGVARMGITVNCRDERPDITMAIGSQCDQGSIRQPGHEVLKLPHLEQCRMDSSIDTDKKAIPLEDRVPRTRPEWDWRSDLQSQMQGSSKLQVEDISSFDSQRHLPEEDIIHSRFLSNLASSSLDTNHMASCSSLPCEISGVNDSNLRSSLDRGSDRLHLPNGFGERSMSSVEHSLFANEGRNKVNNAEDPILSNILSLDFDPWDESLASPHNLADLLGEVDQRSSTLKPTNLLKPHINQSRFSFARYEESSNQAYDSENHSIYGQLSRDQPIQESVVSRDIYRNNLGSQNGFASNYAGGLDNFAASPLFSSHKNPVSRPQVSAPPGFSAPNRLPPPGFSSHERVGLSSDTALGTRFLDSTSLLRNAYQVPPPVSNSNGASDIDFVDPAILAVGRGMVNADLDLRSGFSSQLNSFENETGLHMLRQQSLSAAHQQVNGFHHDLRNLSPSLNDPYGFSARLMDQTQGSSLSPFSQLPRQQPSANSILPNGHWDKWNEGQSVNSISMADLLRNERLGFNGSLYSNGYEEPKFRIPSPGDVYNRTYGI